MHATCRLCSVAAVLAFGGASAAGAQPGDAVARSDTVPAPPPAAAAALAAPLERQVVAPAARFAAARPFEQYVHSDTTRQAEWLRNYSGAATSVEQAASRTQRIGGRWHLLVIAEHWCNDAVNSIPWLARLAAENPTIELRIAAGADAPELLASHRLGERAATPLVLVYDEQFVERGAWIERPAPLRALIASKEGRVCEDTLKESVRTWRTDDDGRTVLDEVLTLLEQAAATPTAPPTATTNPGSSR